MKTLSLCMIVKDEELTLSRVLEKAAIFADEIIIVDTGSTDKTREIAIKAGCVVADYKWNDDFAAARNFSISLSSCDYFMWLDADDVISTEDALRIKRLKEDLNADVIMLPYIVPPSIVFWRERILKNGMGFAFKGRVHEAIEVKGKVERYDIPVVHDKLKIPDRKRNLRIFEKMLLNEPILGREKFYYGSELYYNGIFDRAEKVLCDFLMGEGSPADKGQAAIYLARMTKGEKRREYLVKGLTFVFSPDILCEIGETFFFENDFRIAAACYFAALEATENVTFPSPDRCSYLPHIRLCSCLWFMGDRSGARRHNELALSAKPNDSFATKNLSLFK